MTNEPTTLVLLDATHPDGESALRLLDDCDSHIALMVLLSGRSSSALRDFAHGEDIDIDSAAWFYLDQVVARSVFSARVTQTIVARGPSAIAEITDQAMTTTLRRVLLPSSITRFEPKAAQRLAARIASPVLVASESALVA